MMEAGRSPVRILAPIVAASVVITALLVLGQDRLAPKAVEARIGVERAMEGAAERGSARVPHVRDGEGNVWSIARWDPLELTAEGIRVAPFRAKGQDYDLLEVPRMRFRRGEGGGGGSIPEGGSLVLSALRPGGATAQKPVPAGVRLPTDLLPADIELSRASEDLEGLSSARLRNLRDRSPGLHYLTVLLQKRLTAALANLVLLLVGVPLVLRGQGASIFLSVLAAVGGCASYFVVGTAACDPRG